MDSEANQHESDATGDNPFFVLHIFLFIINKNIMTTIKNIGDRSDISISNRIVAQEPEIKITVFQDIMPCSSVARYQCSGGACCFCHWRTVILIFTSERISQLAVKLR